MISLFQKLASNVPMPEFRGLRILMMPIIFGDSRSVPEKDCLPMLEEMYKAIPKHKGKVVYLTVDQSEVKANKTQRRAGLHVDGYPYTEQEDINAGSWGGGGGMWGGGGGGGRVWADGNGLLTISDVVGCRAWNQYFEGEPKLEGDCEHFRSQCCDEHAEILQPNTLYWLSPACVHESLPMVKDTKRIFVRLSLPSTCDWHEGCTPNPLGVMPTGQIKPRRRFMELVQ